MTIERVLQEIKDSLEFTSEVGISCKCLPSPSLNNKGILNSDQINRLPKEQWVRYTFSNLDKTTMAVVLLEETRLKGLGIYFDKGFGSSFRDWEIDWSLTVK